MESCDCNILFSRENGGFNFVLKMTIEKFPTKEWHNSIRGWFAGALFEQMKTNKDIVVIVGDLGYLMFDKIREAYPNRFFNVGAAESAGMGIAVGMAYQGKIPFVYSITPFLIARPYEWLKNYVNHENLPIKLIGSGRDKDYEIDGFTHDATGIKELLDTLPKIVQLWPEEKEDIPDMVKEMITNKKPSFVSLRR